MIDDGAPESAFNIPLNCLALFHEIVVAFGGGLNSTALLIRWVFEGLPPPGLILFANTGNERQETYDHIARFSEWLVKEGMPPITETRKGGRQETLGESCLRLKLLPSLAYGGKTCSQKFKIEPQDRDVNRWAPAQAAWARGDKVVKIIGYGAEEQKRISRAHIEDDKFYLRFPLDEWGMRREDCARVVRLVGLPPVGKSSCTFCPASTKAEVAAMRFTHPDKLKEALEIEATAIASGKLYKSKGLGRSWSWADHLAGLPVDDEMQHSKCMVCIDQ